MEKIYQIENVYDASIKRLEFIFNNFSKIYISFSGGKDSGTMLHMAIQVARRLNKLPVNVLVVDFEAQYNHTIDYVKNMVSNKEVYAFWVCLPIRLRNSVSQFQTHWLCWDPDKRNHWVRGLPDHESVIADEFFFPFFRRGMEFEEFVKEFGEWFSESKDVACLLGIRTDESLNRLLTLRNKRKKTFKGKLWSTKKSNNVYNFYPIYDWKVKDIWIANGKYSYSYNKIYDLMHQAGVSLHQQRLCQPFGDDQRKGLFLFKILEPDTWTRIVNRVEGANFGNRYIQRQSFILGNYKIHLPQGHTYKSYSKFLLDTMPPHLNAHYMTRINKFIIWWYNRGIKEIPDFTDPRCENSKKAPSWRRICKVLLKNDYWCEGLSFSPTKYSMEHQRKLIIKHLYL